jgi:hypothetical protein
VDNSPSKQGPLFAPGSIGSRLYPAVPRRWLFGIAGVVWTTVGVVLCTRAFDWLARYPVLEESVLLLAGVAAAGLGYVSLFSRVVRKNIDRINGLPESACAFAFTPWKGYLMIGVMVTIGVTLRNSAIPKDILAVPYTAMGGMLLIGSARFFQRFTTMRQKP